jgi:hypothetical protein
MDLMDPHDDDPATVVKPSVPLVDDDLGFPTGSTDETELLLQWLGYQRRAVRRKLRGLTEAQARWTPDGRLVPLVGIVNHLTRLEWRWIDGGFAGTAVGHDESEFHPDPSLTLEIALSSYRQRGDTTDRLARSLPLSTVGSGWAKGHDLRFVLLHLIEETARHAGHADAVRELLDGTKGL